MYRLFLIAGLLMFIRCASEAGRVQSGKAIFRRHCVTCHGVDGKLMLNGAKDLSASTLSVEERIVVIRKGRGAMISFEPLLRPEQIDSVAHYTMKLASDGTDQ